MNQVTIPSGWAPRPRQNGLARGWSNGFSFIRPQDRPGLCSINVSNGTDRDSVLKIVTRGSTPLKLAGASASSNIFSRAKYENVPTDVLCRSVHICARKSVRIQGIGAGEYRLFFSLGTHWDKRTKKFSQSQAALKFVDAIKIGQERGIEYTVTLHPVAGGMALTTGIEQDEFNCL